MFRSAGQDKAFLDPSTSLDQKLTAGSVGGALATLTTRQSVNYVFQSLSTLFGDFPWLLTRIVGRAS